MGHGAISIKTLQGAIVNTGRPNRMRGRTLKCAVLLGLAVSLFLPSILPARADEPKCEDLSTFLEPLRVKTGVPALAAAVVMGGKIKAVGAVGTRKFGTDVPVTVDDQFHLGSCTKAMTATLIAKLVEDDKLTWNTTPAQVFPELSAGMSEGFRSATLRHLLNHRSGLPADSSPPGMTLMHVHGLPGSPREQRLEYARLMLAATPAYEIGSEYIYSNTGFAVAGAMAERVMDKPWETLMAEEIFEPLGITSAGFGPMGTLGKIVQPYQHRLVNGNTLPIGPVPVSDNPPAIGPAGTVHMNVGDWAKFVIDHVNAGRKKGGLLKRATYRKMHKAPFGGDYAYGWVVAPRPWAKGDALTHAGSNTSNFAVVWIAPKRSFAILVMTNVAGDGVSERVDEVIRALLDKFLLHR